jgi:hypothetical protein
MKRALLAALVAAVSVAAAGCGSSGHPPAVAPNPAHPTKGDVRSYDGVALTAAPSNYRPAVSRKEVLALFRLSDWGHAAWHGRRTVVLRTVNGAYPAWVIAFHHPVCTAMSVYNLRARVWTWTGVWCSRHGAAIATCSWCSPMNQDALDAAANYAEKVTRAAHVFGGDSIDDDANTVILHLVHAPKSVLETLRARHPGIYVIHNDAPHTSHYLTRIERSIDFAAWKARGIDITSIGPTEDGHLQVGVDTSVAKAQAALDATFGPGLIRVVHEEPAVPT